MKTFIQSRFVCINFTPFIDPTIEKTYSMPTLHLELFVSVESTLPKYPSQAEVPEFASLQRRFSPFISKPTGYRKVIHTSRPIISQQPRFVCINFTICNLTAKHIYSSTNMKMFCKYKMPDRDWVINYWHHQESIPKQWKSNIVYHNGRYAAS